MPILNIDNMKVVSPSPNNFILDLDISGKHYNYIASGEHIYQNSNGSVDNTLLNDHVAHSSLFYIQNRSFYSVNKASRDNQIIKSPSPYFRENEIEFVGNKLSNEEPFQIYTPFVIKDNNFYVIGRPQQAKYIIFKSTDNCKTWEQMGRIEDPEYSWPYNNEPYVFAADSKNNFYVFITGNSTNPGNHIYRSTDDCRTWKHLNIPDSFFMSVERGFQIIDDYIYTFRYNESTDDYAFIKIRSDFINFLEEYEVINEHISHTGKIINYKKTFIIFEIEQQHQLRFLRSFDSGENFEEIVLNSEFNRYRKAFFFFTDRVLNLILLFYETDELHVSKDFGTTWTNMPLPDDSNLVLGGYLSGAIITKAMNIPSYALFDMNDMGITTDDEDIDNLLLMPNANTTPYERDLSANFIPIHGINCNAVYGYVRTEPNKSFGFPKYNNDEFIMSTHNKGSNGNPEPGTTDTLSLYKYREMATNVSNILGLGKQTDISAAESGFDKMFVFDPTDDNKIQVQTNLRDWRSYQTNHGNGGFTNNFDNSTLLARAILFPKQTLNNEYSTERVYVPSTEVSAPFKQVRRYNFKNEDYFYSNGTHIILNHRDDDKYNFIKPDTDKRGGTMVTSTYSRRFGDEFGKEHQSPNIAYPNNNEKCIESDNGEMLAPELDYNVYGTFGYNKSEISNVIGLYNQYSPELINRENETMSDTALMTARHKTNIFDIEFKNGLWKDIADNLKTTDEDQVSAYQEIKDNLKQFIKTNLFKLVEEIKPAHTELYKITFDDET